MQKINKNLILAFLLTFLAVTTIGFGTLGVVQAEEVESVSAFDLFADIGNDVADVGDDSYRSYVTENEETASTAEVPIKPYGSPLVTKDMILDSSGVNVYDSKKPATWLPKDYQHYWDFSKATTEVYVKGDQTGPKVLKGKIGTNYDIRGFKMKNGAGETVTPVDYGLRVKNVNYAGQLIDIDFHFNAVKIANINSKVAIKDADNEKIKHRIFFSVIDGIYSLGSNPTDPISEVGYWISFYKAGTSWSSDRVMIKTSFVYGDQEGAVPLNNLFSDFPNNLKDGLTGETLLIKSAYNSPKYPRTDFFAPNGKVFAGNDYIKELGQNTNYQSAMFKYRVSATSRDLVYYKMYGYEDKSGIMHWSRNVNEFKPLFAQWSFLFNGSQTNQHIQTSSAPNATLSTGLPSLPPINPNNPKEFAAYWNFIGFASILPGERIPPKKYVSDNNEKLVTSDTLDDVHEKFSYTLEGNFPIQYYQEFNLKEWKLTDTIPDGLTAELSAITGNFYDESGKLLSNDAKNYFDFSLSGQQLTITAKKSTLKDPLIYGKKGKPRFTIPVRITDISKVTKDATGRIMITNQVTQSGTYFNDVKFSDNSNKVTTRTANADKSKIGIKKSVDKMIAEDGKVDPANSSVLQPITYSVAVTNHSTSATMDGVTLLDVLPQPNDKRDSVLGKLGLVTGSYKITAIDFVDSNNKRVPTAALWYKDKGSILNDSLYDVNRMVDKNGALSVNESWRWTKHNWSGISDALSTTSAVLVHVPSLPVNTTYTLKVTIETANADGAVLNNTAAVTSIVHEAQRSNQVTTKILGRSLSGFVWLDKNYDGLQDSGEAFVPDVPVKLYRTSLVNSAYKNELLKSSIAGAPFVDKNGNSLIKTDKKGEYKFNEIPEGDYVVEFILADKVVTKKMKVTQTMMGSVADDVRNSKVATGSLKITTQPRSGSAWQHRGESLENLANLPSVVDGIQESPHNNLGIIPTAKISLFKYETGTLRDGDKNGSFDASEVNAAKGLAGAEFEVYKGKLDKYPTAGKSDVDFVSSGITDSKGFITLDTNLFMDLDASGKTVPTTYTVFETKAPKGYELAGRSKAPFRFEVKESGQTLNLYIDNDGHAELPFTGGNPTFIKLVISSLSVIVIGILGVGTYYFRNHRQVLVLATPNRTHVRCQGCKERLQIFRNYEGKHTYKGKHSYGGKR
ncbi:hypothetical protein FACS1894193_08390 [Bacilli bacterium]|nr:hypothetical protein FACS1894192_11680 [Bacilli bacterium]GHU42662.1 hypothetical protein FACS1894193_08390 [Bacilli bacterium]